MHSSSLEQLLRAGRVYPRGSCLRKQKGAPNSPWPGESGGRGCLRRTRPSVKHLLFRWPRGRSPGQLWDQPRFTNTAPGIHLLHGVRAAGPRSPSTVCLFLDLPERRDTPSSQKLSPASLGVPDAAFPLSSLSCHQNQQIWDFPGITPNAAVAHTSLTLQWPRTEEPRDSGNTEGALHFQRAGTAAPTMLPDPGAARPGSGFWCRIQG